MGAVLGYCDYHLPETAVPVADYVAQVDRHGDAKPALLGTLRDTLGFTKILIADRTDEAAVFYGLMERYFETTGTKPAEIDYLIYTRGNSVASGDPWSQTDEPCINVPYRLHDKFGMTAEIFNVEQECSSTMIAIKLADALIAQGAARKILLLSANFFETLEKRLMADMILVSDGMAVLEISADGPGLAIADRIGKTDGGISLVKDFNIDSNFEKLVHTGSTLMRMVVERNQLTLGDLALIVPQNISKVSWYFYCRNLGFPMDKVFLANCGGVGHLGDVDIIRNLADVRRAKLLPPGSAGVIYGVGTGTSWNALLVRAQ
jgi:3-oxoacyl-[acyl-carrier-protein] synthase III